MVFHFSTFGVGVPRGIDTISASSNFNYSHHEKRKKYIKQSRLFILLINSKMSNDKVFTDYFHYCETSNKTICLLTGCKEEYAGYYTSTLWRHLEFRHKEEYEEIEHHRMKRVKFTNAALNKLRRHVRMSLVELCTVNGRPLAIVEDSGMKKMLDCITETQLQSSQRLNLIRIRPTKGELKSDIYEAARQVKEIITKEVHNKMVSLMIDIVTKRSKSILGVAIQFVQNDKITIRFIGMVRMSESHTGTYIAKLVNQVLSEYKIAPHQIYTLTTDNGSNVLKSVKELRKNYEEGAVDNSEDAFDFDNITDEDMNDWSELFNGDVNDYDTSSNPDSVQIANDEDHENFAQAQKMIEEFTQVFIASHDIDFLFGQPCGAHTLQIEVNAGINKWEKRTGLLKKCRDVVTKLLTPTVKDQLVKEGLNLPFHDCYIRWNTIYLMVSLFQLSKIFLILTMVPKHSFSLIGMVWYGNRHVISLAFDYAGWKQHILLCIYISYISIQLNV